MTTDHRIHLDKDQLLMGIADSQGLPGPLRQHLSTCSQCRDRLNDLKQELDLLGRLAARFSPKPENRVRLPADTRPSILAGIPRYAFGTAAAAFLLIAIVWWTPILPMNQDRPNGMSAHESALDDPFIAEVSRVLENPLPREYMDISMDVYPVTYSVYDEDFIQFVVPASFNEPLSFGPANKPAEKGVSPC